MSSAFAGKNLSVLVKMYGKYQLLSSTTGSCFYQMELSSHNNEQMSLKELRSIGLARGYALPLIDSEFEKNHSNGQGFYAESEEVNFGYECGFWSVCPDIIIPDNASLFYQYELTKRYESLGQNIEEINKFKLLYDPDDAIMEYSLITDRNGNESDQKICLYQRF